MDTQGWYDELRAQLADANPVRKTVIECLKELLEAVEDGEELPKETDEVIEA